MILIVSSFQTTFTRRYITNISDFLDIKDNNDSNLIFMLTQDIDF